MRTHEVMQQQQQMSGYLSPRDHDASSNDAKYEDPNLAQATATMVVPSVHVTDDGSRCPINSAKRHAVKPLSSTFPDVTPSLHTFQAEDETDDEPHSLVLLWAAEQRSKREATLNGAMPTWLPASHV